MEWCYNRKVAGDAVVRELIVRQQARAQASSSRHGGTTTWQWGLGGEDPLLNPRAQVSQKDCRLSNWVRRKFTPMAVTSMMKVSTPLNF